MGLKKKKKILDLFQLFPSNTGVSFATFSWCRPGPSLRQTSTSQVLSYDSQVKHKYNMLKLEISVFDNKRAVFKKISMTEYYAVITKFYKTVDCLVTEKMFSKCFPEKK